MGSEQLTRDAAEEVATIGGADAARETEEKKPAKDVTAQMGRLLAKTLQAALAKLAGERVALDAG